MGEGRRSLGGLYFILETLFILVFVCMYVCVVVCEVFVLFGYVVFVVCCHFVVFFVLSLRGF